MSKANIDEIMRWRDKCEALAGMFQQATMERDEARAKLYEMNLKLNQAYTDAERLQKERDAAIARITEVGVMVARGLGDMEKYAYKRGAEAMREACAARIGSDPALLMSLRSHCESALRALPIPEDK